MEKFRDIRAEKGLAPFRFRGEARVLASSGTRNSSTVGTRDDVFAHKEVTRLLSAPPQNAYLTSVELRGGRQDEQVPLGIQVHR